MSGVIGKAGANERGGVPTGTAAAETSQNGACLGGTAATAPLPRLSEDTDWLTSATLVIDAQKDEIACLQRELREAKAELAAFAPFGAPHLHEFRRGDDCLPEFTVTVKYVRARKFSTWNETKAFMQSVREDAIMAAVKEERTNG